MKKICYLLLAACVALVACTGNKDIPVVLPSSLSVSGEGTEFSAPKAMVKVANGVWDIYGNFASGAKVVVTEAGGAPYVSFDVPSAKAGVCRLRVNGADKSWELVRINKVSLVVTEGGVSQPKEGNIPPIAAKYEGNGVWTVPNLYIAKPILKYRFVLETDTPASLKYWCAGWDNVGVAPSAHSASYLSVRALGQKDYTELYLKDNRACWMFPADKSMMLASFTISMNDATPGQQIAYTSPHKGPKAIFIGDSITWQWGLKTRTVGTKEDVAKYFPINPAPSWMNFSGDNVVVTWHSTFFSSNDYLDKGVSGQNSTEMLARYKADVMDLDPHCVVIMAGTNDLAQGYTKDVILANISSMAESAAETGMKVVLCSVTPCNDTYTRLVNPNTKGAHIIALNEMIQAYAASKGFVYCDYWSALVGEDGLALKDSYWLYDRLHPNPAAYTVMEGIIKPIIEELLK